MVRSRGKIVPAPAGAGTLARAQTRNLVLHSMRGLYLNGSTFRNKESSLCKCSDGLLLWQGFWS